jgi:hypothetical protein
MTFAHIHLTVMHDASGWRAAFAHFWRRRAALLDETRGSRKYIAFSICFDEAAFRFNDFISDTLIFF